MSHMPALPPADNPAARLYRLLAALREEPGNWSLARSWADVLGVDSETEMPELMRQVAEAMMLPGQIVTALEAYPDAMTAGPFLAWVEPVQAALYTAHNLADTTTRAQNSLSEAVMTSLDFSVWLLSRDGRHMPTSEQYNELLALLSAFEDTLIAGDLDEDLRLYLLEHTRRMRDAIRLVQVRGGSALRDAAEFGMGGAVFWSKTRGREPFIDRFWDISTKVATIAQLATTGVAIAPGVMGALPG